MKPGCADSRPLLSSFLDGELPGESEAALRQHLDGCSECRVELDAIREVVGVLAVSTEPDPYFVARFRARRDQEPLQPPWPWRTLALRLLPLTLAAILGGGVAVWKSLETNGFGELEARALGPVALDETSALDPVLRIAMEPFPEQEQ